MISESVIGWERCERRRLRASSGGRRVKNSGIHLSKPECQTQEISGQPKHGESRYRKKSPIDRRAEGKTSKLENLEESKGKREEGRPEEGQRKTKNRDCQEEKISEQNNKMMQRHHAF